MPRDLFGDVTRPSISIGNRKWYTVPVSLLSHSVVIAMFLVLPILAAPMMPGVLDNSNLSRFIDIVPPTPPPAPRKQPEIKSVEPSGPPIEAPTGFTKEPEIIREAEVDLPDIIGGPGDIEIIIAPPPVAAKPPEPPQGPIRITSGLRQPVKVRGTDPVYPPMARAAGVQGIVIIEATISADGKVINARILRSRPLLDDAALDAVRSWEYTPTMLNGVPVPVIMTVTVQFTLSR